MTYSSMSVSATYKRYLRSPRITWPAEIPAQIRTVSQLRYYTEATCSPAIYTIIYIYCIHHFSSVPRSWKEWNIYTTKNNNNQTIEKNLKCISI